MVKFSNFVILVATGFVTILFLFNFNLILNLYPFESEPFQSIHFSSVNNRNFGKIRQITKCIDKRFEKRIEQKGDFFVLYNAVRATKSFQCHESVTYTTPGDYSFLDNVPTLANQWNGPISLALYAPGDDLNVTLESIAFLRHCHTTIKTFVTFHLVFISGHFPQKYNIPIIDAYKDKEFDCQIEPPYLQNVKSSYKQTHNLTYPINIARNVARVMATTHYVFASDIELYPSPNLIEKFLQMISDNPEYESRVNPHVYILPIFEILENATVPKNKTDLQAMLQNNSAFPFHVKICKMCHAVPSGDRWIESKETKGLRVFAVGKREKAFRVWEGFYIGTNNDPLFDERLTWEGKSDKMTQGFSQCLLNYDYLILDNAFIIHKPGIKIKTTQVKVDKDSDFILTTNTFITNTIKIELEMIYGARNECHIFQELEENNTLILNKNTST